MSVLLPALVTTLFLLVIAAAWVSALVMTRRTRIAMERRVSLVSSAVAPAVVHDQAATSALHQALLAAGTRVRRLFTLGTAHRWGMRVNSPTLIVVACLAAAGGWVATHTALQFPYWIAIPATVAGFWMAPRMLLQRQQRRTEQQFMVQFPDAIDMVIRMLRAGLPITAAARAVGNEAPPPVSLVFRSIADQVDIGVPFEVALAAAGESVGLPDFRFFAVAVSLQRDTGGNLAVTLEILGDIIRKRRTVRLRAQAATGEVRMSAAILGGLPFLVTGAFLVISPAYLRPLVVDPRGHMVIAAILVCLTLAYVTMRRMLHSVTMS
jgi:tight adherence protein B